MPFLGTMALPLEKENNCCLEGKIFTLTWMMRLQTNEVKQALDMRRFIRFKFI